MNATHSDALVFSPRVLGKLCREFIDPHADHEESLRVRHDEDLSLIPAARSRFCDARRAAQERTHLQQIVVSTPSTLSCPAKRPPVPEQSAHAVVVRKSTCDLADQSPCKCGRRGTGLPAPGLSCPRPHERVRNARLSHVRAARRLSACSRLQRSWEPSHFPMRPRDRYGHRRISSSREPRCHPYPYTA